MNLIINDESKIVSASVECSEPLFSQVAEYVCYNMHSISIEGRVFYSFVNKDKIVLRTDWKDGDSIASLTPSYKKAAKEILDEISKEVREVRTLSYRLTALKETGFFDVLAKREE